MPLRSTARESLAKIMRWSGAPEVLRRTHRRGHAAILFYHDPKPQVLDAHLRYLRRHFRFTTLDTVVDAIQRRDWSGVPDGAAVLTLDDGHRGNYDLLPVFKAHGIRPTIYLCSQVVATNRRFWFQQPGWKPGVHAEPYKRMRSAARIDAMKREQGFELEREYPDGERQALSRAEIEAMAPSVDFQVHTRFHPILQQCAAEEAWEEIAESKRELEQLLGRECRHFSYPNGDYQEREVELARRAGFASARTVDLGWASLSSDPHRLKVFGISDDASIDKLALQLSGIPGYVQRLAQGQRGGKWPITPQAL